MSLFYVPTWKFIYIIIHTGWSLAWIIMKEGLMLFQKDGTDKVATMNVRTEDYTTGDFSSYKKYVIIIS